MIFVVGQKVPPPSFGAVVGSRIRDKHPGSATQLQRLHYTGHCKSPYLNRRVPAEICWKFLESENLLHRRF
jgi:hypothetical protein